MEINNKYFRLLLVLLLSIDLIACKKILEIDPPSNSLVPLTVFKSDEIATSAILGVYSTMSMSGYASGDRTSIGIVTGLSADEYIAYNALHLPFQNNQLTADDATVKAIWLSMYQRIYAVNSILEGLRNSTTLSSGTKNRLEGEALFLRAFNYFYLINIFGPVPLHLSTDKDLNASAARSSTSEVYNQIVDDLKAAETLLDLGYLNGERVRVNKCAAQALLSRVYLYLKDWRNAEEYASKLILQISQYELLPLDQVFLKNSKESIWQLMPPANSNTNDANLLILTTTPVSVSIRQEFYQQAFENNDLRKNRWIGIYTNATGKYYYPFKYKVRASSIVSEYATVLRLAEQFLIRAEARFMQNKVDEGLSDINIIRRRSNLTDLNNTLSKTELLDAVVRERRVELFSEWGHRWFDLLRNDLANNILTPIKSHWKTTSVLFPISIDEINRNKNVIQNDGY